MSEITSHWLKDVACPWPVRRLKYVTDFINGAAFKPSDWGDQGIPIIRIQNLNGGESFNYTTKKVRDRYLVKQGDILFGWSGNRGTSFGPFFWEREGTYYLNQHIFLVHEYEKNRRWLYWVLKAVTHEVEQRAHGIIGMVHITRPELDSTEVPVPPLPTQKAIADFLDRKTAAIDALIAKKQRLLDLLAEKRAALINQAVTKGLDPSVPMKDSGIPWIGEIPAHWEMRRVKHLARLFRGRFSHRPRNDPRLYGGPYPFLQTGDVAQAGKYIETYKQTLNELGLSTSRMFPSNTIVMAIAANVGDVAITTFDACFPDSVIGLRPTDLVDHEYLFMLLEGMRDALVENASENTQKNLNIELVGNLAAPLPPLEEQARALDVARRFDQRSGRVRGHLATQIERLQEYRQALITAAVTGQLDIPEEPAA